MSDSFTQVHAKRRTHLHSNSVEPFLSNDVADVAALVAANPVIEKQSGEVKLNSYPRTSRQRAGRLNDPILVLVVRKDDSQRNVYSIGIFYGR